MLLIMIVLNAAVIIFILRHDVKASDVPYVSSNNFGSEKLSKRQEVAEKSDTQEVSEPVPKTRLVYKDNVINIVEPDYPEPNFRFFRQFPRYYYPREYPPFYGYYYGTYDPHFRDSWKQDHHHDHKETQPIYQNTINNYQTNSPSVVESYPKSQSHSNPVKVGSSNPVKDFLNRTRRPKVINTAYHPADGQKHTGFVKELKQDNKTYKVFIPDEGTKEGDVYTTSKKFEVEAEPIKETVEVDGKKIDIELTAEQSLEEIPVVEAGSETADSTGSEKFTKSKIITLQCGKKVRIVG